MIFAVEEAILKAELQITSLNTVDKQDAKSGHLGTSFPFFIRLSSKFAEWQNLCSKKSYELCFSILTVFRGKWRQKFDSKVKFQLMA